MSDQENKDTACDYCGIGPDDQWRNCPLKSTPCGQLRTDHVKTESALRARVAELEADAARYRFLAGADEPPHSERWSRWRVEHWHGYHAGWEPLADVELDQRIDAARSSAPVKQ